MDFQLKEGSLVLHQVRYILFISHDIKEMQLSAFIWIILQYPNFVKEQFRVLKVNEDNTRMSSFVMQELHDIVDSYENGRTYYEFTGEEDLLYYKQVMKVPKSLV